MKNSNVLSGITGAIFFAIPYLALGTPILPSLAIGVAAFGAGELIFKKNDNVEKDEKKDFDKMIKNAKEQNKHIITMISKIEDKDMRTTLNEIHSNIQKIIRRTEKNSQKVKGMNNFYHYYLPSVVKIIDRYDEIENQRLSSKESKEFHASTKKMLEEANRAFQKMLNDLYEKDMIDTSVEMKVLNSMLKSDGFGTDEFDLSKENGNE